MSFNTLRTLGPANDFANDATISYTLKAGELLRVGETIMIAVGSAGSGGAWVASAADTQGNTYTVDAIDNATGGALVGIVSSIATTALAAGDTITVTLNAACTAKRFFARVVNGTAVASRVDVSGVNGVGGAGNTVPTVTTGLVDGAGTPSPTTDPDDYAFMATVWNGSTVLTEDSQVSELNSGHFDNVAAGQTKQMAVAERQLTTAAVKTFTGSLAHSQQWAMAVVTYKPQAAAASDTLGPNHLTGPANTIGYTLAAGESVPAGSTAIVHVGAAGSAGAVVASIADSQGNVYTVDDSTQNGTGVGGACASIGSGLIQTALHAGDTITATFGGSPPNRNILIRVVSGLVTVNRVDQTSTDSTTGTSPTVTTGIEDGAGTATPIGQGAEYGAVCLVWDAGATLTEDAALTSVWKGHFDYPAGGQVKQMAVSEHQFTTATIKTFTDNLGAAQGYAMVLVTYRINVANAATLKPAPSGLSGRDISAPPSGYQNSFHNMMFDVDWAALQPTRSDGITPVNENALDSAEVARIRGILDHLQTLSTSDGVKYTGSIRLFAGYRSPKWLANRVGTFSYKDPANASNPIVKVPRFWTPAFLSAWDNLQQLLAAQFDDHPALAMLQLANAMTYFAEELIRHTSASQNIAELVGGGKGWSGAYISPSASAGYSDAANQAAIKHGIDTHKANWPNTPASISYNPYDKILSEAEAQSVQPGITYGSPLDNQIVSTDDSNLTITKRLIDYHVAQLWPLNLCVLENNSVRSSYFTSGGALITSSKMGQMYAYMVGKGVPLYYQMAGATQIGNFNQAMAGAVGPLKANAVEPTHDSGAAPYDSANLATWDAALRGNPIPVNSSGRHSPTPTSPPVVSIHAGTGFVAGTVLRSTMGVWDGGTDGVSDYVISWYRVNPASGARTLARGPTTYTASGATDDYTIQAGDETFTLESEVVADNAGGTGGPSTSSQTPAVQASGNNHAPNVTTLPVVTILSGSGYIPPTVLQTDMGSWDGGTDGVDSYVVRWFHVATSGTRTLVRGPTTYTSPAATDNYTLQASDGGFKVESQVTASNVDGASSPAVSNLTPTISGTTHHAPTPTAQPNIAIISGTGYTPGTILQTDVGIFDGGSDAITQYAVSWYDVDPATGIRTLIQGPTDYVSPSATDDYTLLVGDEGSQVESEVIATNAVGTSPPDTSTPTPVVQTVATPPPSNTLPPSIIPSSPQPGQALQANHGAWTNNPISYTYRFDLSMDDGTTWVTVRAASPDPTYQTKNNGTQDGGIFRVRVIANNGQAGSPVFSPPTAPLTALPPVVNPFGGPVDLPGWAYGEAMPAWLRVDGVEVANWARTWEYLTAGLQGGYVSAYGPECVCQQLYDPDSTGTDLVFQDPVTDQAPWYDPQRSESIQFLGLIVTNVTVAPQRTRAAVSTPGRFGGAVLSPTTSGGMVISVTGVLVSASKSGADYGEEWLRGVLSDPECDVCETNTVEVRLSCPPDDGSDETLGYWVAYRTGLTTDLAVTGQDVVGAFTDVSWTWTSAEAYLYKPSSPALPATILTPAGTGACIPFDDWFCGSGSNLGCYTIVPPNRGAWGAIITVTNTPDAGVGEILLDLYSPCPPSSSDTPDSSLLIIGLAAGETLVIDSSQHIVTRVDVDGNTFDGLDHIYVPAGQPLQWIEVLDCDPPRCICVSTPHPCSGGESTTVGIDVQYRRRG